MQADNSMNSSGGAPENLFVLVLIDLYSRGRVPDEILVQTMSIVVSFIRQFDDPRRWYADSAVDTVLQKLMALDSSIGTIYKSSLWTLENLDDVHSFFDGLESQTSDRAVGAYARPLRADSVVGGFVRDMVVYFQRLDFSQRAEVWESFKMRRKLLFSETASSTMQSIFSEPVNEAIHSDSGLQASTQNNSGASYTQVLQATHNLDLHGAISEIHRVYDESSVARPAEALVLVFCVLAYHAHVDKSLRVAEEAIVSARTQHDMDTIATVVMRIWETLQLFPDAKIPKSIGSMKRLMDYLLTISNQLAYSLRFKIAVFEITYLRESGTRLDVLARKLDTLMKLYTTVDLDDEATSAFHVESYHVWSLYGKANLAQCHYNLIELIRERETADSTPTLYRFQTCVLLEQGFEGDADSALAKLASLEPKDNIGRLQLFKITKLVLNVISLTKRSKFHEATTVLSILKSIPARQCVMYQNAIDCAEIELLLAQGHNAGAYEASMSAHTSSSNAKFLLYAARSLFCFSESSMKVRRIEALEVARSCESCNSVPIKIEAKIIRAFAHAHSENLQEFKQGIKLCDECIPQADSAHRSRLLVDALVIRTMCVLQLYYLNKATISEVKMNYNRAQAQVDSFEGSEFLPQSRQLRDLYEDILKEVSADDADDLRKPKNNDTRTSFIKVMVEDSTDLKRKSYHSERRASKRRRSLLMPL